MNKKIRWGIIGCGHIADNFARDLKFAYNSILYAVASRTDEKAKAFCEKHGGSKYYNTYEELVKDNDVDVVYVATTHNFHYRDVLLCLNNNKHVLCEKAFTLNAGQAKELIQKAREKNLFLMEAMWTRFFPCIKELNSIIDKGTIGEIKMLQAHFGIRPNITSDDRKININLGGGALLDLGIYPISFSQMIFRKFPSMIKSSAVIGNTGVDEQSSYLFQYDNGETALLFSSFVAKTPTEALIVGTKGHIRIFNFFHPNKMVVKLNECEETIIEKFYDSTGYQFEAMEVADCIIKGKQESDFMTLDETLEVIEIMDELRSQWGLKYPGE